MSEARSKTEQPSNTGRKRKACVKAKESSATPQTEEVFSIAQSEGKAIKRKVTVPKKLAIQHSILTDKPETSRRNLFEAETLSSLSKPQAQELPLAAAPATAAMAVSKTEPDSIQADKYYAVDYVDRFYIGRVLSEEKPQVYRMKFLHKTTVGGVSYFSWPGREDSDSVHRHAIFYGPVLLHGCLRFTLPEIEKINAAFAQHTSMVANM